MEVTRVDRISARVPRIQHKLRWRCHIMEKVMKRARKLIFHRVLNILFERKIVFIF